MATSKTLTPTNVTIQIPAFAEKPDQRVNSNCIDKEADAINALSDQMGSLFKWIQVQGTIGDLSAGAYGYKDISIEVPTGYKTTGIVTVALGHPGVAGGLVITPSIAKGYAAGTRTGYLSYYTPRAITASNTDFDIFIQVVNANYNI